MPHIPRQAIILAARLSWRLRPGGCESKIRSQVGFIVPSSLARIPLLHEQQVSTPIMSFPICCDDIRRQSLNDRRRNRDYAVCLSRRRGRIRHRIRNSAASLLSYGIQPEKLEISLSRLVQFRNASE
ncbi:hypothetical protein [Bradyrhizobium cenepequi]|uniref:hypothetical protein n=1 Tax=Bradyrhizobium cenepequi TaxID=2821403 RepID=UPI001CE239E5|nr:hypothetical protein [Bradyrhizobium cenepequi]MCA6107925.1 hypothetical protein [Bradyrhizobium cenepequi]